MAKPNRTLAFLGFGSRKSRRAEEEKTKPAEGAAATSDDDDEEDEEEEGSGDDREAGAGDEGAEQAAAVAAARAAAIAAERTRIGAILSGVDPAQAELAVHLALNTDMTAEQARAALGKAGKGGGRTPFAAAMASAAAAPQPGFGAGPGGKAAPSLADRMATTLKQRGL